MIANARMYSVNAVAKDAWRELLAWVMRRASVSWEIIGHDAPAPLSALWVRAGLGCALMCGLPFALRAPAPPLIAAPVPSPQRYGGHARYMIDIARRLRTPAHPARRADRRTGSLVVSRIRIRISFMPAWLRTLLPCLLLLLNGSALQAQAWPAKPIRIIVPFVPGGPADLPPRLIGPKRTEAWGQPVVVENKPGAGGNIGMDLVAKAAPDGYTLVVGPNGNLVVNPHLYPNLPYDVFRDFTPVTLIATFSNLLVVHPDVPAKSVPELIALAKAKPGTLSPADRPAPAASRIWAASS